MTVLVTQLIANDPDVLETAVFALCGQRFWDDTRGFGCQPDQLYGWSSSRIHVSPYNGNLWALRRRVTSRPGTDGWATATGNGRVLVGHNRRRSRLRALEKLLESRGWEETTQQFGVDLYMRAWAPPLALCQTCPHFLTCTLEGKR